MKRSNPLTGTLHAWSRALGVEPKTIGQRLTKCGVKLIPQGSYTAKQIFLALHNDRDEARTRKLFAEAQIAELELKEKEGSLVNYAEAEKVFFTDWMMPAMTEINFIGERCAALANPENPGQAFKVLSEWAEQMKKQILSTYENNIKTNTKNEH